MKKVKKQKLSIVIISIVSAFALILAACAIYLGNYYHADEGAVEVFSQVDNVSVSTLKNGTIVFEPKNATQGFIFYPGGKVEHKAYEPLMASLARSGILCVLVKMPFNLAVFDINAADGIQEQYPNIENWYIGGHSLGGSMAASYLEDCAENYKGLILLGSYSTSDLSNTKLNVLSIYGSEDKILNKEKYDENKSNLPSNFKEIVISGGNHSQFGMYGQQKGDGTASIPRSEQTQLTAFEIIKMMQK